MAVDKRQAQAVLFLFLLCGHEVARASRVADLMDFAAELEVQGCTTDADCKPGDEVGVCNQACCRYIHYPLWYDECKLDYPWLSDKELVTQLNVNTAALMMHLDSFRNTGGLFDFGSEGFTQFSTVFQIIFASESTHNGAKPITHGIADAFYKRESGVKGLEHFRDEFAYYVTKSGYGIDPASIFSMGDSGWVYLLDESPRSDIGVSAMDWMLNALISGLEKSTDDEGVTKKVKEFVTRLKETAYDVAGLDGLVQQYTPMKSAESLVVTGLKTATAPNPLAEYQKSVKIAGNSFLDLGSSDLDVSKLNSTTAVRTRVAAFFLFLILVILAGACYYMLTAKAHLHVRVRAPEGSHGKGRIKVDTFGTKKIFNIKW